MQSNEDFHLSTSNTQERACLNIVVKYYWSSFSEQFLFMFMFNPPAPSKCFFSLCSTFKKCKNIKRYANGQRILETEHSSFTPIAKDCLAIIKSLSNSVGVTFPFS